MLENAVRICDARFGTIWNCAAAARYGHGDTENAARRDIKAFCHEYQSARTADAAWRCRCEPEPSSMSPNRDIRVTTKRRAVVVTGVEVGGVRTRLASPWSRTMS